MTPTSWRTWLGEHAAAGGVALMASGIAGGRGAAFQMGGISLNPPPRGGAQPASLDHASLGMELEHLLSFDTPSPREPLCRPDATAQAETVADCASAGGGGADVVDSDATKSLPSPFGDSGRKCSWGDSEDAPLRWSLESSLSFPDFEPAEGEQGEQGAQQQSCTRVAEMLDFSDPLPSLPIVPVDLFDDATLEVR